jgi:hypothetical protein
VRDRADVLRRRVAYYRRRLSEGIYAELAQEYVRHIGADEAELAEIETDKDRRE